MYAKSLSKHIKLIVFSSLYKFCEATVRCETRSCHFFASSRLSFRPIHIAGEPVLHRAGSPDKYDNGYGKHKLPY